MSTRSRIGREYYDDDDYDNHRPIKREHGHASRNATKVYDEEIEIHKGKKKGKSGLDFLRDDHGKRADIGEMVIRDRSRSRSRSRSRDRTSSAPSSNRDHLEVRADVRVRSRSRGHSKKKPSRKDKEYVEEEVLVKRERRPEKAYEEEIRPGSVPYEEVIYYVEAPPQIRREDEEFYYREAHDARDYDRGHVPVPPIARRQPRNGEVRFEREDYDYRQKTRKTSISPPRSAYREEIIVRDDRREPTRDSEVKEQIIINQRGEDFSRHPPERAEVFVDDYELDYQPRTKRKEEIIFKDHERDDHRALEEKVERIIIQDRENAEPRHSEGKEEIVITTKSRRDAVPRSGDDDEHIIIATSSGRDLPRGRADHEEEVIITSRSEREPPRRRGNHEEEIIMTTRSGHDQQGARDHQSHDHKEDIIISTTSGRDTKRHNDHEEYIIRERQESPRYEKFREDEATIREREAGRDLRRPGTDREIIISRDNNGPGHERDEFRSNRREREDQYARTSRAAPEHASLAVNVSHSERSRAGSVRGRFDGASIRGDDLNERDDRHRREIDDDVVIRHKDDGRGGHEDEVIVRHRRDRSSSTESYRRHRNDYLAEYRAPTSMRDEQVDVRLSHRGPDTRQRRLYDDDLLDIQLSERHDIRGVRHGRDRRDYDSQELRILESRGQSRRLQSTPDPRDRLWTEITRDLVSEAAIKEMGYEYEATPEFFYIMRCLEEEDVLDLQDLTEEIRIDRQRRIRAIQGEREVVNHQEIRRPTRQIANQAWDEERVIEREITRQY